MEIKEITRDHFWNSDYVDSLHETELVQVVRKTMRDEKCPPEQIAIGHATLVPLGTIRLTGVYVRGRHVSSVRTCIDKDGQVRTSWEKGKFATGLPSGVEDWQNL